MKALTYPDEFVDIEGAVDLKNGLIANEQPPKRFGLCYRTKVGNDVDSDAGYKIHLIYNVLAIPSDKSYSSIGTDVTYTEFEWTISAIPEDIPGLRPTAHITINSIGTDPWLLEELEEILYGDADSNASLLPMDELISIITEWYRVKIVDHQDGTWSAIERRPGSIFIEQSDQSFYIINVNSRYIDDVTFVISDTTDMSDVPEIVITDTGDGTWNASTSVEGLISIQPDGHFEIKDATAVFYNEYEYEISNTGYME
jgi:hypothetical protein